MSPQRCTLAVERHIDIRLLSVELEGRNDAMTAVADSEEVDEDVDEDDGDFDDDDDEDDYDDEEDDE